MIVVANTMSAIALVLGSLLSLYFWIVIIAAVLTWVRPDPYNPIVQILFRLTNPVYAFIRRLVPTLIGGIDLAPLIVILTLQFIDLFAVKLLFALANAL